MGRRINAIRIRTPEGITFALVLASPITRSLAWVIDLFVVVALESVLSLLLTWVGALNWDFANAIITIGYFVLSICYPIALEWGWKGQTLGKKVLRLRVIDERGLRLTPSQIIIRNLFRFVDMLPGFYCLGGMCSLLSSKSQRLGDFAANTVVIRQPKTEEPDIEQLPSGKFNSFRDAPQLEARLRQVISSVEAGLAFQAVLRRNDFDADARTELFRTFASHLRDLVRFPDEITEGLSDEQYVRNAVDTIYRKRVSMVAARSSSQDSSPPSSSEETNDLQPVSR